jgi:hypothetical protein
MHGGQKPLANNMIHRHNFPRILFALLHGLTFLPAMLRGNCRRETKCCRWFGKDPQGSNPRGQLEDGA